MTTLVIKNIEPKMKTTPLPTVSFCMEIGVSYQDVQDLTGKLLRLGWRFEEDRMPDPFAPLASAGRVFHKLPANSKAFPRMFILNRETAKATLTP